MSLRVSTTEIANTSIYSIENAYSKLNHAQGILDTGEQLQKPSDNPAGVAQVLNFNAQNADLTQYNSVIDQGINFLSTSDSALSSVTTLVQQARTIAVQAASATLDLTTRSALTTQLQNIISQIGNIGNTSYDGRYIFAGQRTQAPPLAPAGGGAYTYVGGSAATGDGAINLDVGQGETLQINTTGDLTFAPLLNTLQQVETDVSSAAVGPLSQTDLANLDVQYNNILGVRADIGSKIDRLNSEKDRNTLTQQNLTKFVSQIQDADIPSAVIKLQTAQTAYQAALQTTASVSQLSLLNFLR